jgi:transcriptional regulator with XRE-family HTH domain
MDDRTVTVGQRVRQERTSQGMSLRKLARLAGLSASFLSLVETGQRNLDSRHSLGAVADALGVPVSALTGQPYEPKTRQEQALRSGIGDLREALHSTELGQRWDEPTRGMQAVRAEVERAGQLARDSRLGPLAQLLPQLLTDLYALTADPDGGTRAEAMPMLVRGLYGASWVLRCAGEVDLAWTAAERVLGAAREAEDPVLIAFAQVLMAHAVMRAGRRAGNRAAMLAGTAAAELQPHVDGGPAGELYGWSHLTAAWALTIVGAHDSADEHLAEAADVARHTGEGTSFDLWFGPNNLGLWRMAIAVERGEGGQVAELSRAVQARNLPSRSRRSSYFTELGRGMAQEPATARQAIDHLERAERLAGIEVRGDPFVRATVQGLLRDVGGERVRDMARHPLIRLHAPRSGQR